MSKLQLFFSLVFWISTLRVLIEAVFKAMDRYE